MSMEYLREFEDLVGSLQLELDAALDDADIWRSRYYDLLDEFHRVCDERSDLRGRINELECYIERDKDGDGFICKDAMDLLFPDTTEGEP